MVFPQAILLLWSYAMNKESFLEFLKWLDTASLDELRGKHREIDDILRTTLRHSDVRADAKRMLRLIEQEIMERLNAPQS
jgi:hypothetical protein